MDMQKLNKNVPFQSSPGTLYRLFKNEPEWLSGNVRQIHLKPNEVLFEQDESGNSMYVLMEGVLGVRCVTDEGHVLELDRLGEGAYVGEMSLVTGQPRVATVYAVVSARLVEVTRELLLRLMQGFPALKDELIRVVEPRIQRTQLAGMLADLIGEMDPVLLRRLQEELVWRHVRAGEVLIRQGEVLEGVMLVVNGRFRVIFPRANDSIVVREIIPGEFIGEFTAGEKNIHTTTVVAVRDSEICLLKQETFNQLQEEFPHLRNQLVHSLVRRIRESITRSQPTSKMALAVVPLVSGLPMREIAQQVQNALAKWGLTLMLDSERFDEMFGLPGASELPPDHPFAPVVNRWLMQREQDNRFVVFVADEKWTEWSSRCLRGADRVLLVTRAGEHVVYSEVGERLRHERLLTQQDLVLVDADGEEVGETAVWLQHKPFNARHHARLHHEQDWERIGRFLTGKQRGLILSTGGSHALAHIGSLRAIEEQNIFIDFVAGVGMGAILGALYLCYPDRKKREAWLPRLIAAIQPLSRSLIPFSRGYYLRQLLPLWEEMYGDTRIEAMRIPLWCLVEIDSQGKPVFMEKGRLADALNMSLRFSLNFGQFDKVQKLLVKQFLPCGSLILFDVLTGYGKHWPRWVHYFRKGHFLHNLAGRLFSVKETDFNTLLQQAKEDNLLIHVPLSDVPLVDFGMVDEIIARGYVYTLERLQAWQKDYL